jgi:putative hydrolase of the HAD superfamily
VKVILWDFDGTLAYRDGMWSATLLEVLHAAFPDTTVSREAIRPYLQTGFPWHTPALPHTDIRSADEWWTRLFPVFERAFLGVGIDGTRARQMAAQVRSRFLDESAWHLYDDVLPTLARLTKEGWSHQILSNHVPELADLVRALGLDELVEAVHCSAVSGYEKPHPEAFRKARETQPPDAAVWMIGDNMEVDVLGAEACGIRSILVRRPDPRAARYSAGLAGVDALLNAG